MLFNNELIQFLDVKKKVQHVTTKYLFPKIHTPQLSHTAETKNGTQKTKSISKHTNNKDVIKQNDVKNHNMTNSMIVIKEQHLYSKNTKDILTNIHKNNLDYDSKTIKNPDLQEKLIKTDITDLQIEKINRLSHRDGTNTKLRSTFVVRKSQNCHYNEAQHRKEASKCGKKYVGHYNVVKELGHGGFATVFQVTDKDTGKKYAMKEYTLAESLSCYRNQVTVGEYFKLLSLKSEKNTQQIVQYIEKIKTGKKGYIIQELAGQCFSKLISEIKGTFHNKQRVYEVRFLPFYQKLKNKQCFLFVMSQICRGVKALNDAGFVHCDLKLENVLISSVDNQTNDPPIVKLIDFGSTFQSVNGLPKITITPEYMPPQLLMQFSKNNVEQTEIIYQKIDVWSIGCLMFEIFTGIPLWFKYKCKLNYGDRKKLQLSIFALTNRDYSKMIKKQHELCESQVKTVHFVSHQWQKYRGLLRQILVVDPRKRISVETLLKRLDQMK